MSLVGLNPALWHSAPRPVATGGAGVPKPGISPEKPAASAVASLADTWDATRREMQEKFLSRRLETAEKIVEALRPQSVFWAGAPSVARAMAVTLGRVASEIDSVVRDMEAEFSRRTTPGGVFEQRPAFKGLFDQAERAMTATGMMVLAVALVPDADPLGRGTPFDRAADAARTLDTSWKRLQSLTGRHALALTSRVDLKA